MFKAQERTQLVPVSVHERTLRNMRCVVSGSIYVTLHHAHGGSMLTLGPEFANPGMGQRNNPFFQIPVHAQYHVGEYGIDTGMGKIRTVEEWEEAFGSQVDFLHEVNGQLTYDLWEQARLWNSRR